MLAIYYFTIHFIYIRTKFQGFKIMSGLNIDAIHIIPVSF